MEYLEPELTEGFRVRAVEQLGEAINFAVTYHTARGETDTDELRQAAQDSLSEMLPEIIPAIQEAYKRSPLKAVDFAAMEILFRQLAIRAKLEEHKSSSNAIILDTHKGSHAGIVLDIVMRENQEQIKLQTDLMSGDGIKWVPVKSVQSVQNYI